VTNTDGTVSDDSGSTLDLIDAIISGGTVSVSGILDSTGTSAIDNASITNTGTMESTGGVLTIDPELSVTLTNSGTLQANGGELDITGEPVINTGTLQAIDDSILKLTSLTVTNTDGTVSDDSGSTLDLIDAIISGGTVSVSGILDSTGTGAIDNASITNTGTMESTGGTFTIDAASSLTNTGTLEADGGTLFIKGDVSGAGAATITDGGTLDFAGADAQTVTFDGAGTLKLEASANFAGTVSGLTTGDAIDLAGTVVTSAYFVGPTLLVNGQPTSFQISSVPAGDTIAFKTDGSGGTDLKVLPQVLAVGSPPPVTGVEGAAIQLDFSDTVTGASLSKFVISGIPDGAIVSDGTAGHSYISGSADGSVDVASWNLSSLTITPANDANFTLSAIVTAVDSNGFDYTLPATEVVTVNPTAPTLTWAAQVSGTETQVALGNLAETITSASGDSNSPNTLTISGAPQGVVLSDGIHTATSDGHTAIDISAWNLSCLTADTSKASVPDGNFSLTATATEKDADGNVSASTMVTEQVTVNPTAPTLTWAAQVSGTETQVALGSLTDTITGHTGDSNSANTLTISGAPQGAVLSDGIHIAISDGHTAIDVSGWNLSCLTANTSGASIPDGNFTLTATATEKDAEHNVSATTTATETVTVTPEAPTVSPVAESGTEGTPIALDLGTKVNGLPGDQNTLASLVVSAIPVGATLKDDQGHTFTATVGSGHQQVDVHGWDLSALTITPVHDTNFALSVAATEKDADGDLSATTTGTEAVTVYDHPTILGETNPATQTIILDESPVVLAAGAITNSLGMPTETFDEVHPGLVSNNGFGHGSFTSFALDATFSSSGDAGVVDGSSSVSAPPFIGPLPGHVDATNYLSIGAGGSETISFATEQNEFGLYWGSVDPSNTIDFYNGTKLVASYTGADISPLLASGGQGSFSSNGYVEFSDLVPFNKVVLSNGNANAFEIDNISAADSHIHLAAPITGTLTVSDDDIGDTLTASVTGDAVVKYNGSTNLPSGINVDALINPTAVTFDSVKADGGADVLHWTYNPTNPDLDFLEPGDTLTVTFNAQVSNGHASAGNQPLTITLVGTGASVVNGTAQNDTFVHVGGGVTIFGNGGNDTFVFSPNFGSATIGDFNVLNDTIDIDHTLFSNVGAILASAQPANFGHDTIITDAAHDKIVLTGVTVTQLNAHDFHLV
jgi:fibronectin-binding autotransporter adhesin